MPDTSHAGFEYWETNDLQFAFPIGQIDILFSDPSSASVSCDFAVPTALPHPETVAERSIGIQDSFKFWFAVECTKSNGGIVTCEAVLRARHMTWFASHGETGPGPLLEIRLTAGDLGGSGWRKTVCDHGPHCDSFSANWGQTAGGRVFCSLTALHWTVTAAEYLAALERARKAALHEPPLPPIKLKPLKDYDWGHPPPKPADPQVDN